MRFLAVKKYLTSDISTPYFVFINDTEYNMAINDLWPEDVEFINTSDYCPDSDKVPDIDALLHFISIAQNKKYIIKGLGEYLALCGSSDAIKELSRFKNKNLNGNKVILFLRGLKSQISGFQSDPRFENRLGTVIGMGECNVSLTVSSTPIYSSSISGIKAILTELEKGIHENLVCDTNININNSLFPINRIKNAYEGIRHILPDFEISESCGNDKFWIEFLNEIKNNDSLENIFHIHQLDTNLENDFYTRITGKEYRNWIYFIALKIKTNILNNTYLRLVLENTDSFEDFRDNILKYIIEISPTDRRFSSLYKDRKSLVKQFTEFDIEEFINHNRIIVSESIFRLTDNTIKEREEIVTWISKNGIISEISDIYPDLSSYLNRYVFKCPFLAGLLTEYFEEYKHQKLSNILKPEFLVKIDELAQSPRKFNQLPTRNEILDKLDKTYAYLYWLDALGVEYLSFIEFLAQKYKLSISINIARAELPTITSINKDFYDAWEGNKEKNTDLDDTKHKAKGGYNYENVKLPIHLVRELDIIKEVIEKAATTLAKRDCKRFLIVSDHGASRLAVLHQKEEKYDTETQGEHSGRCCKLFQPYDLPFAIEENDYLVLADYGRFKGSRAANVEVHGGASLEEVVVPIIELTLSDKNITVKLIEENVGVDSRTGTEIELFLSAHLQDISVVLNGKSYNPSQIDENHYSVKLLDIKRAGIYDAFVYSGDNLIGNVTFKTQGKIGNVNADFDNLF